MAKAEHAPIDLSSMHDGGSNLSFLEEEAGQTVTEYAVVLTVVIIALAGVVFALQGQIESFIDKVASEIANLLP
jgi:Flp pilus assembly pilin Flp